ncbi:hypothetical protein B2J88_29630 [Rhodococcus sp. SRB_17]|nr:hypothetical protein [Rhodococcus sp. SRB_17]
MPPRATNAAVRVRERTSADAAPTATTARTPVAIVPIDQNLSPDDIDVRELLTNGASTTTVTINAVTPLSAMRSVLMSACTAPR